MSSSLVDQVERHVTWGQRSRLGFTMSLWMLNKTTCFWESDVYCMAQSRYQDFFFAHLCNCPDLAAAFLLCFCLVAIKLYVTVLPGLSILCGFP